jgi:hypothetical protein
VRGRALRITRDRFPPDTISASPAIRITAKALRLSNIAHYREIGAAVRSRIRAQFGQTSTFIRSDWKMTARRWQPWSRTSRARTAGSKRRPIVGWKLTQPYNVMPPAVPDSEVNTEVGAVATIGSTAFDAVCGHQWIPDTGFIDDPNYQRNEVERRIGDRVVALGPGTATAIRGRTLVGFSAGLNPFGPSCERPRASYALERSAASY